MITTLTNKQQFEQLAEQARSTMTHDSDLHTPYDAVWAGFNNAQQTDIENPGEYPYGSEEFYGVALGSIHGSCEGNAESGEHWESLKAWFKTHGLSF
jgi:hypothetical protein